ncbi:MAG: hypothetical protein PSX71_12230 [bacterium]|nr:hypothetical protein [bacterium]
MTSVTGITLPLTVSDLTDKFGEWCQGHGPVSWYKTTDHKEIWFWWKKPIVEAVDKNEQGHYQILMASLVAENDESVQEVIWPKKLRGKQVEAILSSAYK